MKRIISSFIIVLLVSGSASAQVKLEDIPFKLGDILGQSKVLTVKKGFNPVFKLGKFQVNKVGILGEKLKGVEILGDIFDTKGVNKVMKLYKTYRTGLVVFKVLAAAGTAVTVYSTVKGAVDDQHFDDRTVKQLLFPALSSVATGVITKILTKKASYKAVDIFNGVVTRKVKDIFSVKPASQTLGVGLYVNL